MSQTNDKIYSFEQAKKLMAERLSKLNWAQKPHVYRIEIKIKPIDQIAWLEAQTNTVKIYGASQDNQASIAGVGEAYRVQAPKIKSFEYVFKQLRQHLTPQYPYLQWYGGFCFDQGNLDPNWKDFSAYCFVLPRFELASDGQKMIFCCNLVGSLNDKNRKVILKELSQLKVKAVSSKPVLKTSTRRDLPSKSKWDQNASHVLENITKGEYEKVVLARKTILKFPKALNSFDIFRKLYKVTPNSYHFLFQFGSTVFLGASPERLYQRRGRNILSEAIAGTSPRGKNSVQDEALKKELAASNKNNHEHAFVVRAIKTNLGALCTKVSHAEAPQILSLGNGHHLLTPFQGELRFDVRDEDILSALHPTPAVAGTTPEKALKAIRKLEGFSRGWYAGPLGYVGLDWAEFVVGIRSGVIKGNELSVYAGAGIVKGSEPQAEWLEIENKISNFIKIIQTSKR